MGWRASRIAAVALVVVAGALPLHAGRAADPNSPLGTNLVQVVDFASEYPFVNFFKQARPWISGSPTQFETGKKLKLDGDGYPTKLKKKQIARSILFTGLPADPDLVGRQFILRHDGEGVLDYAGSVTTISQGPDGDLIEITPFQDGDENIVIVNLTKTNKKDPVRNIRLTPTGGICASGPLTRVADETACAGDFVAFTSDTVTFNPEFLASLQGYRSLRFMDWMRTNNSAQHTFADRPLATDAFWSTDAGVPAEIMVELANALHVDPWFNIPHQADDGYVEGFAAIVRDNLAADLEGMFEYSNEVWNSIFEQTEFARSQGLSLGLDDDPTVAMVKFYSRRAQQVFAILEDVFGGTTRIERVMATQVVVPFFTETILGFEDAAQLTDAFAVAPYFGLTVAEEAPANEIKQLGVDGVFDWLTNDNNAVLDFGSLPSVDAAVEAQIDAAAAFGKPLIAYEGGQHFLAGGPFQSDVELNAIFDAVNGDPRIKDIYLSYLREWQDSTGHVFWHYLNCDRWGDFGRWGALEYQTQPRGEAPKYDALQTFIENDPLP